MPDMPETRIRVRYENDALIPDGNFARARVEDIFGAGEVREIDLEPQRSRASHNHAFAFIDVAWSNLPEDLREMPWAVNRDTFRKHALIATGYCDTALIACGDERRAERMAKMVEHIAANLHGYVVVQVSGPVVYCHTPQSQSLKAMGKERFQQSKQAILEWMAALLAVEPDDLAQMGRKRAA